MNDQQNTSLNPAISTGLLSNDALSSILVAYHMLLKSWKNLVIASTAGAIVGFSGWFFLGSYSAEYILFNNGFSPNLLSWKILQNNLPILATQINAQNRAPESQQYVFKKIASEAWWSTNVKPTLAVSKIDVKELPLANKEVERAASSIVKFSIQSNASTQDLAVEAVNVVAKFLRTGGSYIDLLNLINRHENDSFLGLSDLKNQINAIEIEIDFQLQKVKTLEDLNRRFPGTSQIHQSLVDAQDANAKYLPLPAQIIAVNVDIARSKELLKRYHRRTAELMILNLFITKAKPFFSQSYDGLQIAKQLIELDLLMRSDVSLDSLGRNTALDEVRGDIFRVQRQFTSGLEVSGLPSPNGKKGMLKSTFGGLVAAFSLMVLFLLGRQMWLKFMH